MYKLTVTHSVLLGSVLQQRPLQRDSPLVVDREVLVLQLVRHAVVRRFPVSVPCAHAQNGATDRLRLEYRRLEGAVAERRRPEVAQHVDGKDGGARARRVPAVLRQHPNLCETENGVVMDRL